MDNLKNRTGIKQGIWFLGVLTIVVGISYGIGLSRLSFYGDDWIYIYNYHIAGSKSFTLFTQSDRPYSAWIYVLTSAIFGESAIWYHIYVFVLRWISAILFWRILSYAFHNQRFAQTAALLFATYPGFQQQPIAVEYVMHFTSLVLVELSLWLMQKGFFLIPEKKIPLFLLSLITAGAGIFTCEYFLGLEFARPIFLYFTIKAHIKDEKKYPWKKNSLSLLPYICMSAFYLYWRVFVFSFTTYEPKLLNTLKNNPVTGIKLLVEKVIQDIITVLVRAYRLIFSRPSNLSYPAAAAVIVLVGITVFLLLYLSSKNHKTNTGIKDSFGMFILGFALLLLSGIPYWGTFLDVSTDFPWDRSTLSFSPGAAIIIAAILNIVFTPFFFYAAAASITALSALFHAENTQIYLHEAAKMNDYFWQLAWRAPGLEQGTILASENIPLDRTSDSDLSPVVNWQYSPEKQGLNYDYKYFDLDLREGFFYTDPTTAVPVDHTYRTHRFRSSTDKTLGLFYKKNGCLQIIDSTNTGYPDLPESLVRIAPLSNTNQILTKSETPAQPPAAIGTEPEHGYCYFFQKITLAQQTDNKKNAYDYALEALRSNLHPFYAPDLAPVILAFLQEDDIQSAESMISGTMIGSGDVDYLCNYWQNGLADKPETEELQSFYKSHGCK